MAETNFTQTNAPITEDGFLADRMSFWGRVTGATVKVGASIIFFCAWLWWCTFYGFGFFHALILPVVVAAIFVFL
ncbi:MAG TPA: hypothetical protein VMB71_07860 [Acetobacteraceae bacterium]|nr:hypothetical protein [Acetobacteraceae bacterium]